MNFCFYFHFVCSISNNFETWKLPVKLVPAVLWVWEQDEGESRERQRDKVENKTANENLLASLSLSWSFLFHNS